MSFASFGFAMEVAQGLVGRNVSLYDATANVLGVTAGILLVVASRVRAQRLRPLLRVTAGLLLACGLAYPSLVLLDVLLARLDFPKLATFKGFSILNWICCSGK